MGYRRKSTTKRSATRGPAARRQSEAIAPEHASAATDQPASELDLGTETVTLDAVADLEAALGQAEGIDPFQAEADWARQTARRWRGAAFDLADAHAHFDEHNMPTTPFGKEMEHAALGDMQQAIENVESTGMGLESLRMTLDAGGATLKEVDATMQVSLGVLERRGYLAEGASEDAGVLMGVQAGEVSEAGGALGDLTDAVGEVVLAQGDLNVAWAEIRARAIEASVGPERARKQDIEEAVAYIEATLTGLTDIQGQDFADPLGKSTSGLSSVVDLLTADELARLQARIDAAAEHAGSLRAAADREALSVALERLGSALGKLHAKLDRARPSLLGSQATSGEAQTGTSTADALAAQRVAAEITGNALKRSREVESRMDRTLAARLHEPARSVLHGPSGLDDDRPAAGELSERLAERQADHRAQIDILGNT